MLRPDAVSLKGPEGQHNDEPSYVAALQAPFDLSEVKDFVMARRGSLQNVLRAEDWAAFLASLAWDATLAGCGSSSDRPALSDFSVEHDAKEVAIAEEAESDAIEQVACSVSCVLI